MNLAGSFWKGKGSSNSCHQFWQLSPKSKYPNIHHPKLQSLDCSLFQNFLFLLFVRGRQPHRLLSLVIHHLLHHAARLTVQV